MGRPPVKRVGYQTVYLWTCPDCRTVWQLRKRPRAGKDVACAPSSTQRLVSTQPYSTERPSLPPGPCATVHTSTGKREGIAPNL
jgi:hypothetical protein